MHFIPCIMSQSEPIADMVTQMQEPTSGQFSKENEAKTSDVTALVEKEAKSWLRGV